VNESLVSYAIADSLLATMLTVWFDDMAGCVKFAYRNVAMISSTIYLDAVRAVRVRSHCVQFHALDA